MVDDDFEAKFNRIRKLLLEAAITCGECYHESAMGLKDNMEYFHDEICRIRREMKQAQEKF